MRIVRCHGWTRILLSRRLSCAEDEAIRLLLQVKRTPGRLASRVVRFESHREQNHATCTMDPPRANHEHISCGHSFQPQRLAMSVHVIGALWRRGFGCCCCGATLCLSSA